MVRTKVFVGNLSFKTQESDLAKEFEVAGKVATANIISRGSRSLGYGFVEFESEEEAKKAVELLNKKQIDSREINVEVARPRDENAAPRPPRQPRAPRAPRQAANNNNNNNNNNAAGGQGADGQSPAGERRPRFPRRTPRERRPREGAAPAAGGEGAPKQEGGAAAPRPRRERPPRKPRVEGERAPRTASPNTLFVANLPFAVDDAGLAEIFAGLNLKSAHVVRKRNNRSKGFGFVEFNNADDQAKALQAVDKKKVQERELIVKAALTEAPGEKAPVAAAAAAAPASPAAAVSSPKTN
jgi:RNA recognition motif-containing protein